ncbi:hypothetical protein KP001_19230 [Geomonas subterranea]|uniref:Band 7 domain-containing protein n=1 Tax=Geomonas subterranea TaxID=2847989 RepID=A0ABX8LEN6_9BACT|nr:hypothetical protein [Geomonas subterranea]QXE90513.1 hypothetical protein KP001_19230 [Geomonas subterranea]QXM11410.1 hypothetical protein KP002_10055 [Geomonas subterranea]
MRSLANIFLILFFADGFLSVLDELSSLVAPVVQLTMFRMQVANTVLLLAVILYLCLGIDRRLPKKLFVPLIAFLFICPLAAWLLPALGSSKLYAILMSALQLGVPPLMIARYRDGKDPGLTLPPWRFEGPFFGAKNTMLFIAVNVVLLPVVLATLSLFAADALALTNTSGFIRVTPRGLYLAERVYRRGNQTVRLTGMVHIGEKGYYQDVARVPASGRTVVLAEGVTDQKQVLRHHFDYREVAGFLGLASQEKVVIPGRMIDQEELQEPDKAAGNQPDILVADTDLSTFRPETLRFLDQVGKELQKTPSFAEAALNLNRWAERNVTPQMQEVIMDDILTRRNQVLLGNLDRALERYDTVVVPWGALHMKGIEEGVLERGFVLQKEQKRLAIDLKRMLLPGPR